MNLTSMIVLMYLIRVRPLVTKYFNFIEIFNEVVLYGCTGLIIGMTDYQIERPKGVSEAEFAISVKSKQNQIGWAYIIMACVTIVTTIFGILFNVLTILAQKCKALQERKKAKKQPAEHSPERKSKYDFEINPSIERTRLD